MRLQPVQRNLQAGTTQEAVGNGLRGRSQRVHRRASKIRRPQVCMLLVSCRRMCALLGT